LPKSFEAILRQRGVPRRVLDIAMAEVGSQRARVVAPLWFVVLVCSTIR
jgi:hypothetical protein